MNALRELPVIDIEPLVSGAADARVAREIEAACRDTGFFYIVGHGVSDRTSPGWMGRRARSSRCRTTRK